MQFFIALGILVAASSAYLLHQFWSRSLSLDDAPPPDVASADTDAPPGRLKLRNFARAAELDVPRPITHKIPTHTLILDLVSLGRSSPPKG